MVRFCLKADVIEILAIIYEYMFTHLLPYRSETPKCDYSVASRANCPVDTTASVCRGTFLCYVVENLRYGPPCPTTSGGCGLSAGKNKKKTKQVIKIVHLQK